MYLVTKQNQFLTHDNYYMGGDLNNYKTKNAKFFKKLFMAKLYAKLHKGNVVEVFSWKEHFDEPPHFYTDFDSIQLGNFANAQPIIIQKLGVY